MGELVLFCIIMVVGVFVLAAIVSVISVGMGALRKWLTGKMR